MISVQRAKLLIMEDLKSCRCTSYECSQIVAIYRAIFNEAKNYINNSDAFCYSHYITKVTGHKQDGIFCMIIFFSFLFQRIGD